MTDFGLDSLLRTEFVVRAGEHSGVRVTAAELMGGDRTPPHSAQPVHGRPGLARPQPSEPR